MQETQFVSRFIELGFSRKQATEFEHYLDDKHPAGVNATRLWKAMERWSWNGRLSLLGEISDLREEVDKKEQLIEVLTCPI